MILHPTLLRSYYEISQLVNEIAELSLTDLVSRGSPSNAFDVEARSADGVSSVDHKALPAVKTGAIRSQE
jgi:hypothetical protein